MKGKDAVIFLVGLGLGAIGAYVLLNENFEKKIDEEIEAYKQYQEDKHVTVVNNVVKEDPQMTEIYEEALTQDKYQDYTKKYKKPEELVKERYYGDDIIESYEEGPSEDDVEEDYIEPRLDAKGEYPLPYLITPEQFENDVPYFDKITISYYYGDDTLADEQEEIIPDIESVIGEDALYAFGMNKGDPDIIHVRNERLASDFEICRTDLSYAEHVLGIFEDKPRPPRRRKSDEEHDK